MMLEGGYAECVLSNGKAGQQARKAEKSPRDYFFQSTGN
jgi:hypothetical protein